MTSSPPYLHQFSTISGGNCINNAPIHSEGPLEVDEPDIPEAGDPVLPTNEDQPANNSSNFINIPEESLKKMKVSELKSELSKHGQQFLD